jgi:hypothetical protein
MNEDLVQRWIDVVNPFDLTKLMAETARGYGAAMGWDEKTKAKAIEALQVDVIKLTENLRMFAEENFSEDSLTAAVRFFESTAGQKYLLQREVVIIGTQRIIAKGIGEAIKRLFG